MTDAPGDFEAVHLVVHQVAAHRDGGSTSDSTNGWEILEADSSTYDLMTLRDGVFAGIGLAKVPAGHYTQLRLKLGANSDVVMGGVTYPLDVPSGLQSGLKLVGSFDVPANGLLEIALDFDAGRSIVTTGAGGYVLEPTVRVVPFSTAGAISGSVQPAGAAAGVFALQGADTVGSASTAVDGTFQVSVLPQGTYSLALHPQVGFRDTVLSGVVVTAGSTASVGNVQLTAQ